MDRISEKFLELKERGEGAHMAHIYYGDPNEEFSIKLIETLVVNGTDIIELGIPFSDPIADGPVFQAACERALNAGITPIKCIDGIKKLRSRGLKVPIIVTTYFNIPFVMGFEKFLEKIRDAGAQGILIPDLPLEEAEPYLRMVREKGLHLIFQIAPTTSNERLKRILTNASGFVYLISLEGVTGSKLKIVNSTFKLIKDVKAYSPVPIMVGFGISRKEHAEVMIANGADGVVVGSAYTRIYSKNLKNPFQKLDKIAKLVREIKSGCINGYKNRSSSEMKN
ncbi:MAG: tryptophan synthase subunit alpha [Nitrososphaerota archaeon]|nr:tryptophan synthase subunit alpha [Nitrososphaerales archaeon]MDW8044179.1 tryptophan synthase subunit alpha [Nitrososphaerota archaeon]